MTWTKLSDDWSDDCWTLSDGAHRLHADGHVWSNRKLLDLEIPKDDLPRLSRRPDCVQELLDGGWWVDAGSCYRIVHHADYQRTREQVIKQQGAARANGKLGGRPGKPSSLPSLVNEWVSTSESEQVMETGLVTQQQTRSESEMDGTGQEALRGSSSLLELAGTGKRPTKMAAVAAMPLVPSCGACVRWVAFGKVPCPEHHQAQETA